jgi:hypothetical protein
MNISGGTVTQSAGQKITIGAGGFTQTGGTFIGSGSSTINDAIDISTGAFSLTSGSFTSTAGKLSFTGSFTIVAPGSFTHNSGTIALEGSGCNSSTIDANGVVFNIFSINKTMLSYCGGTRTLTIAANTTIPLGSNPTFVYRNNTDD